MWIITKKEEENGIVGADGKPVLDKNKLRQLWIGLKPGDYHISDDERSVYTVHKDGSLRRIKDKDTVAAALGRFRELKKERDERIAAAKAKGEQPLTAVSPKVAAQVAAMMAMGAALPQPQRLHV